MLKIQAILHATDFSQCSGYAFQLACSLARDHGGRLIVLHVLASPETVLGEFGMLRPAPIADTVESLKTDLAQIQPSDPNVVVERQLVEGVPAEGIVAIAEATKCDLIVMGTHGRAGLAHLLMGSVAEHVVRRAPCPVLVVKTPFTEDKPAPA